MVVEEGLFVASSSPYGPLPLATFFRSSRTLIEGSHPSPTSANFCIAHRVNYIAVVNNGGGEGFEPSKSMTADLQSAPFGRSGTPPRDKFIMLLAFYSGKDYSELKLLTLRAVACGNVLSLLLESNLEVDDGRFAVSSLMIAREPHHG